MRRDAGQRDGLRSRDAHHHEYDSRRAATTALLSGSTLYVAGTSPSPANNTCAPQAPAATICGRLDIVDLSSDTVTGSAVITDGYHMHMDLTANGQLFVGSLRCTNIGNVNFPSGEVRGCLSIYKLADGSVSFLPTTAT